MIVPVFHCINADSELTLCVYVRICARACVPTFVCVYVYYSSGASGMCQIFNVRYMGLVDMQ